MSKSLGNVYTVNDIQKKGFSSMALRLLFLSAHYRSQLNFTWKNLEASQKAWERLVRLSADFKDEEERTTLSQDKLDKLDQYRDQFFSYISNDLDTPQALGVVWEMVKSNIPGRDKYDLLLEMDGVLGLRLQESAEMWIKEQKEIPQEIHELAQKRWRHKTDKQFAEADIIRNQIVQQGWVVEDQEQGYIVKKKKN